MTLPLDPRTRLLEAARTIERLNQELQRNRTAEPLAVIGMAVRMPGGAQTPEEFWDTLSNGVDTITDFPAERGIDRLTPIPTTRARPT